MENKEGIKEDILRLERELAELKARMPAHSVPVAMLQELEDLEDAINENVAGVSVPEDMINEMAETKREDRKRKAVEISSRIIKKIKPMCQGVHIMPLGGDDVVPGIIESSGLNENWAMP
ncbi:MAG: hypothetical protein ACMUIL_09450 [bacterium]